MKKRFLFLYLITSLFLVAKIFAQEIPLQGNQTTPKQTPSYNQTKIEPPSEFWMIPQPKIQQIPQELQLKSNTQSSQTPQEGTNPQQSQSEGLQILKIEKQNEIAKPTDNMTEELSVFEEFFRGKLKDVSPFALKQFGYDLFKGAPSTFAPVENVPVSPDYVIGPGDEIRITLWGSVNYQWNLMVDRDGNVYIPTVGTIGVAGLTFRELREVLYNEISKYYKNFQMNVSMGRLRTITVYVVGAAAKPGAYTISSLATLVNALFAAGGPSKVGSMRDIKLIRNGKTIVNFDVYEFILEGNKSKDVRLMPEDVIYIPPCGPQVAIVGNVKMPAIYELKGKTKLSELIDMAGGVLPSAYLNRVQVERVYNNEMKIILDIPLKNLSEDKDLVLKDGDIVKIFPIMDVISNSVTLKGHVSKPGRYQWFEGMRVSDLIKEPEKDFLPDVHLDFAVIERLVPPDYHKEIITFNLGKAVLEKDKNENKLLQPFDTVIVYSKWDIMERPKVLITGAVNKPGEYELARNMKISDLIKLAGGLKEYALLDKAELTRIIPTSAGPKIERIELNLSKVLEGDPQYDLVLYNHDHLLVRAIPEWNLYGKVTITGEVKFPGTYTIKKSERLSSLIERAGGFTDKAYLRGAVFIRESVRQLQQKHLDEMISRLEREIYTTSSQQVATALTQEEVQARKAELEAKQRFIQALKQLKATGRITIRLAHLRLLKGSEYDIELEDGDRIHIPTINNVVNVMGAVNSPGSYIYSKNLTVKDYIYMAGGYARFADEDNVYILKVDGSAKKLEKKWLSWNPFRERWELTFFGEKVEELEPGDTIVVPEKTEYVAWLREIRDITQILMNIAVTAGVVIKLY